MSSGQFLTHGGADRTLAGRRGERQPLVQRSADLTVSVDIFHGRIDRTGLFCALQEPTLHRREVGCPAGVGRVQTAIDDRSPLAERAGGVGIRCIAAHRLDPRDVRSAGVGDNSDITAAGQQFGGRFRHPMPATIGRRDPDERGSGREPSKRSRPRACGRSKRSVRPTSRCARSVARSE